MHDWFAGHKHHALHSLLMQQYDKTVQEYNLVRCKEHLHSPPSGIQRHGQPCCLPSKTHDASHHLTSSSSSLWLAGSGSDAGSTPPLAPPPPFRRSQNPLR